MAQARPRKTIGTAAAGMRARRDAGGATGPAWGRGQIAEIQRARIVSATFEAAARLGAANVSVADVVARSGVSRRTFYEAFDDREDCLSAAFEHALASVQRHVLPAFRAPGTWRERIRAGLTALLGFLDEQPKMGGLLLVDSQACGATVAQRRAEIMQRLVAAVAQGEAETRGSAPAPPLVAEGAVGGALSILQSTIANPAHEPLLNLTNPLTGMIVLPYLGAAAARRELDRPLQVSNVRQPPAATPAVDPFKHAGLRLTYRTVRVLMAIAELSNAGGFPSNRQIGARAGVVDQGQISKLLRRLHRAGLIDNKSLGPGQGAPNAWTLTDTGRRMTDSITAHTGNND